MNGRAIPGYFYDEEKKKYFKIQPSSKLPQGSKYSRENAAKEEERVKKRRRVAEIEAKRLQETVQRSRMLASSHSQVTFAREQGSNLFRPYSRSRASAFASQLEMSDVVQISDCQSCGERGIIFDFAIDSATDAIIWGLGGEPGGRVEYLPLSDLAEDQVYTNLVAWRSDISSISITNSRVVVATALASDGGNVFVAGLSDSAGHSSHVLLGAPARVWLAVGEPGTTIWTSSTSPAGSKDLISIGHSGGATVITTEGVSTTDYKSKSEVRAIDWLDDKVTVGATMRGKVFLWDTRTWGSRTRFQHPDSATAIRPLGDGNQILVAGFNTMAIYDVRMTADRKQKPVSAAPTRARGHRPSTPAAFQASTPVLDIPSKSKLADTVLDLWPAAKLVARRDDDNVVQLYSLADASHVRSLGPQDATAGGSNSLPRMRRLRFVEDRRGQMSLMACQGAWLREWSYGGREDDEGDVWSPPNHSSDQLSARR